MSYVLRTARQISEPTSGNDRECGLPRFTHSRVGLARLSTARSGTPADADNNSGLPARNSRFRPERAEEGSVRQSVAVHCSWWLGGMADTGAIAVAPRPQLR